MKIRIAVTAEHIAAAPPPIAYPAADHKDPVELAIAEATGQAVTCDRDGDVDLATIGQDSNTLVLTLPAEPWAWIDRYYAGETVEPFAFSIEIEEWLIRFLERAA